MPNTIGDLVRKKHPDRPFKSFRVEVIECCQQEHPPKSIKWEITDSSVTDHSEKSTKLYQDTTTVKTAGKIDFLYFVGATLVANQAERSGNLSAYHNENGYAITRSYKVTVDYGHAEQNANSVLTSTEL